MLKTFLLLERYSFSKLHKEIVALLLKPGSSEIFHAVNKVLYDWCKIFPLSIRYVLAYPHPNITKIIQYTDLLSD